MQTTNTRHSTTVPPGVYRDRRARLARGLQRPLLILAGHAPARNYEANPYLFRAGSSYLYFGGPPLEGAAWFIEPGSDGDDGCVLLRPPPGPDDALWMGEVPADPDLAAAAGIAAGNVRDTDQLATLASGRAGAFVSPPDVRSLNWAMKSGMQTANADELTLIINMRLIKDEHELAAMRRAAAVSVAAQREAMAATKPGRREADVAAAFMSVLTAHECEPSFTPIITVRGEVLHSHAYYNTLQAGQLLLCDAAAQEPTGYAGDVTRTYPVNGVWTPIQRHLYETTARACRTAIAACVPGRRYRDVHDLAAKVLCEGLIAAGILRGDPEDLSQRRAHMLLFPHGVGHLIGLDVHDMEDFGDLAGYGPGRKRSEQYGYKFLRLDRDLEAGMTVTIEPGIYLVPAIWKRDDLVGPLSDVVNHNAIRALLADSFGGIRVEETIRVLPAAAPGPEVLTADLPSDPDEVAGIVGSAV